jgi:hypothetical protein
VPASVKPCSARPRDSQASPVRLGEQSRVDRDVVFGIHESLPKKTSDQIPTFESRTIEDPHVVLRSIRSPQLLSRAKATASFKLGRDAERLAQRSPGKTNLAQRLAFSAASA